MFYCEPCGHANGWPTDFFVPTSRGGCEVCNVRTLCFDVPSKTLAAQDPWTEIIPGESEAVESIKQTMQAGRQKCSACGTRGANGEPHVPNSEFCREMQYERAWKNRE